MDRWKFVNEKWIPRPRLPRGRGTAPAVDRVLSQTAYLRRSSSLFFMPPSPSNLRPFGAPPSIGRRERPREPLPLEGAAERSETGLASFFCGEAASSLPSPSGKGGSRQRHSGDFVNGVLETIFPALFHTAIPIQPPPLRGTSFRRKEGVSTLAPSLGRGCRAQRGGVGFLFCGEAASFLPSPLGKGDHASGARVLSLIAYLRRSPPLFFIPLVPYPARSARHLPHAGKALFRR